MQRALCQVSLGGRNGLNETKGTGSVWRLILVVLRNVKNSCELIGLLQFDKTRSTSLPLKTASTPYPAAA